MIVDLKNIKKYHESSYESKFLKLAQHDFSCKLYTLFIFTFNNLWIVILYRNVSDLKFLLINFLLYLFNITKKKKLVSLMEEKGGVTII